MGQFLRIHDPNFIHFVTNRCEHEMFLLLPRKQVNEVIKFWFCKAHRLWGRDIEIFGFVFLSNHFHILLRDPRGQLAKFMCYFQGNVARALNRLHKRSGRFWSREFDDVIVDGEEEFWNRFAYTTLNAVKSGLVATPEEWQGFGSYEYLMNGEKVTTTGVNLSKYNNATRHGRKANKEDFEETFSLELARPPMLQEKSLAERRAFIDELFDGAIAKYNKERRYKPALGMKRVLASGPFDRPKKTKRSPRFKFLSFSKDRSRELWEQYKAFVGQYRSAVHLLFNHFEGEPGGWRAIKLDFRLPWPDGSYPPCKHRPCGCV